MTKPAALSAGAAGKLLNSREVFLLAGAFIFLGRSPHRRCSILLTCCLDFPSLERAHCVLRWWERKARHFAPGRASSRAHEKHITRGPGRLKPLAA
jgi:hypothetical protein